MRPTENDCSYVLQSALSDFPFKQYLSSTAYFHITSICYHGTMGTTPRKLIFLVQTQRKFSTLIGRLGVLVPTTLILDAIISLRFEKSLIFPITK